MNYFLNYKRDWHNIINKDNRKKTIHETDVKNESALLFTKSKESRMFYHSRREILLIGQL